MPRRTHSSISHRFSSIFGCQGKQTDDTGFEELQRLLFFCPANKIHILRATASRVEIGSFQVRRPAGLPRRGSALHLFTSSSAFMIDRRLAVQVVARNEVTP